jgi:hypothetical protein
MSGYPYDNKIRSDDQINGKSVFSSDGAAIGNVEAALADSFIVRTLIESNNTEIKYDIPRIEIEKIVAGSITLRITKEEVDQKYQTSSIQKSM